MQSFHSFHFRWPFVISHAVTLLHRFHAVAIPWIWYHDVKRFFEDILSGGDCGTSVGTCLTRWAIVANLLLVDFVRPRILLNVIPSSSQSLQNTPYFSKIISCLRARNSTRPPQFWPGPSQNFHQMLRQCCKNQMNQWRLYRHKWLLLLKAANQTWEHMRRFSIE